MTTLNIIVEASADDAVEGSTGTMYITNEATLTITATGAELGWRWTGISSIKGKTINNAYLSIYLQDVNGDDVYLDMYGEDSDSPAQFTSSTNDIQNRTYTTAKVDWDQGSAGAGWETSPDLATIIQEIADRPSLGDALVLIGDCQTDVRIKIYNYDSGAGYGAQLDIDFDGGGGTTSIPVIIHHLKQQSIM